ncbi:MAG: hypothetical protein HC777_03235 [Hyphomonadaceae bacterium]|nr:hypothetical protein [Hyphomonadaceae bacterium]
MSLTNRNGANKARVFKSALGIGQEETNVLRAALLDAAKTERLHFMREDQYGKHYAIVFELSYGKRRAFVRSLWTIKTSSDIAHFVSAFVVSDKRAQPKAKDDD